MTGSNHTIRRPEPKGRERRKTVRLLEHWHQCRGHRRVPLWSQARSAEAVDLGEFCVVWKSASGACSPDTRQIGARFIGDDTAQHALTFPAAVMLGQISEFARWPGSSRCPKLQSDKFDLLDGRSVKTRMCFVPFEDETPAGTRWVALADWWVFDDSPDGPVHPDPASTQQTMALPN